MDNGTQTGTGSPESNAASWASAAQNTPSAATPPPATQPAAPGAPPSTVPANAPKPPAAANGTGTAPVVLTPKKRGGILGVVDSVADALVGRTRPEMATDQDGNQYVKQTSLTHGEQWARIGQEALVGAAHGLAAGKGAGNMGKAAAAGVDSGLAQAQQRRDQAKQMTDEARQSQLDNANNQMLRMKIAEEGWRGARLKVEAGQHDIEFAQNQTDRLTKAGGTVLATAAHPGDIGAILKVDPDLMKNMVQNHLIEIVPHVGQDGVQDGVTAIKMPDGYRKTLLPAGTVFHTFDSTTGKYVEHHASDPMTAGELDDYETAAGAASLKFRNDQAEQNLKDAQAAEAKGRAATFPSEIYKNEAAAKKDLVDAANAGEGGADNPLVQEIGTGRMAPERLGYLMARNPQLLDAVAKAYPDFDAAKAENYIPTYKDFTSGKTSVALNAGGTALKHLKELADLNTTASHIPHTAAWTAYQNKADTLSTELAKFYGDATIPAIQSIRDTLTSTLPGNRQSAIETQAKSMGDKLDSYEQTWKNAAPSKAYEAPMPGIDAGAKEARAALDPAYKSRYVDEQKNGPAPNAAQQAPTGVSLRDAMALPQYRGQTADQVREAIKAAGHQVLP